MASKILVIGIVMIALISGAAIYYLQVHAYYEEVVAEGQTDVRLTSLVSGAPSRSFMTPLRRSQRQARPSAIGLFHNPTKHRPVERDI